MANFENSEVKTAGGFAHNSIIELQRRAKFLSLILKPKQSLL